MTQQNYLYKTDYLHTRRTWVKRALFFLIFAWVLRSLPFEANNEWIKNLITIALLIVFIVTPRQEIGIDKDCIYFFDTSVIPFLSGVKKYKLSKIESIRVAGVHNKTTEVLDGIAPGSTGGMFNYLEMNLKDGASQSYRLQVYKKDLNTIVRLARARIDYFSDQK